MKLFSALVVIVSLTGFAGQARSHCEIPCGIYGDDLRFELLAEHITTIEKSMQEIRVLAAKADNDPQRANQLARWVKNKEVHAEKLQQIVYQYFMNQRIKPVSDEGKARQVYLNLLSAAHALSVDAMKAKQSVDLAVVAQLRKDLAVFRKLYK